jgi:hypothetical protein
MAVVATACANSAAGVAADAGAGGAGITVAPAGPVTMGYLEQRDFLVTLSDADGNPVVGEPVQVGLVGRADNGSLTPVEFATDGQGQGKVTFVAPDKPLAFQIRFTSPAADEPAFVQVETDPGRFSISATVAYAGKRAFGEIRASIYADIPCAQLASDSPALEFRSAGVLPAEFSFAGLKAGVAYTVAVSADNESGAVRADACADGLVPSTTPVTLDLADIALDPSGVFDVTDAVHAGEALAPAVDHVSSSFGSAWFSAFASDVPGAILDAVREVIAGDEPLAAQSFDTAREDDGLDALLASDLEQRDVDVASRMSDLWQRVETALTAITELGVIEIGNPADGEAAIYHRTTALEFESIDAPFAVENPPPDVGEGKAVIDQADPDILLIGEHRVALGIGRPLAHVVFGIIGASGADGLSAYLEADVDCDAVATALGPALAGIAEAETIRDGCREAMSPADVHLADALSEVNAAFGEISFEGSCRLDDPGAGDKVVGLSGGVFSVIWDGIDPLGPMDADFTGQASESL